MESYPDVLLSNEPPAQKVAKVAAIKGMATKTAEAFVERIPSFIQFMQECGLTNKLYKKDASIDIDTSHPLFGKTIVMTGFRDAAIQDALKKVGANSCCKWHWHFLESSSSSNLLDGNFIFEWQ